MIASAAPFTAQKAWGRFGLGILAGASLALAQAPFNFPWIMPVLVPLVMLALDRAHSPRAAAWLGWSTGLGHFAFALSWIVEPFLVDIARHGWMAPFALILLAGGLALFWSAAFAIAARLAGPGWSRLLTAIALWAGFEWLRGHILTGFPWALPAYGLEGTPLMQASAWIGPYGLSLILLFLLALPSRGLIPLSASLVGFSALWIGGETRMRPAIDSGTTVRLIQPNAAQNQKWLPEMIPVFFERQVAATEAAGNPDVVIWSETAVPFLAGDRPDLVARMAKNTPIIYGLRRIDEAGNWYNSMAVAMEGQDLVYLDKVHLVPFGEYMPFARLFAQLGVFGLAAEDVSGFSAGESLNAVQVEGMPVFLPLICYEAVFPEEVRAARGEADWFVHITNDAWFGRWTGPYQHLAQARFRAVEHGVPVARAANTGISAMIDPFGRVIASLPLGVDGFVDAALPIALPQTMYGKFGDALFAGLLGLVATAGFLISRRA
ncbi:apolipoprotein N-acyltransferase [Algicella marina]|uniref:Apolipoprotein N-acyltransferase n=1 Tax=Algicella marina TaxID=2683284 RepID=A0A6P1T347_9RHOB|nr:apolipoprotein N-acyltransferase [Algicella marina]QHQ36165.1 apolipoprotein N-acyltransferase [Algicella marina]